MSRRSVGLNARTPEAFVEINDADAINLGISDGQTVEVSSRRGKISVSAVVSGRVDKGVVFIPFHYAEAAVNKLTIAALDPVAKIPEYKVAAVNIKKADK
jgi:predicted molibdopterin-dependent oxidoreductase YjgC